MITEALDGQRNSHIAFTDGQHKTLTALQLAVGKSNCTQESVASLMLTFQISCVTDIDKGREKDEVSAQSSEAYITISHSVQIATAVRVRCPLTPWHRVCASLPRGILCAPPQVTIGIDKIKETLHGEAEFQQLRKTCDATKKFTPAISSKLMKPFASRMDEETLKLLTERCQANREYSRKHLYDGVVTAVAQRRWVQENPRPER